VHWRSSRVGRARPQAAAGAGLLAARAVLIVAAAGPVVVQVAAADEAVPAEVPVEVRIAAADRATDIHTGRSHVDNHGILRLLTLWIYPAFRVVRMDSANA
jgi:hypothetical protein